MDYSAEEENASGKYRIKGKKITALHSLLCGVRFKVKK
jgi:hypothetical protein